VRLRETRGVTFTIIDVIIDVIVDVGVNFDRESSISPAWFIDAIDVIKVIGL